MMWGESNSQSLQILINYWELKNNQMGSRLEALFRNGIHSLVSFVPWQAVESDINHTLTKFLQAAFERKMRVSLILTPEIGVSYPGSGLPKDLLAKSEMTAKHTDGGNIFACLPPQTFSLPSLCSTDFQKRYHNFLTRMDHLLADLDRSIPGLSENLEIVLTGSYWKYYRSPRFSVSNVFGGLAGDYSNGANVMFRQRLENHFSQREFTGQGVSAAQRWKTRALEEGNRKWFYQQSEDVFRARSTQYVRRKAIGISVSQMELYSPEVDPGFQYHQIFQNLSGNSGDFFRLSQMIDQYHTRQSGDSEKLFSPFVRWSSYGAFRTLADSEKQYLILKSLLLMGGLGGGLLIDESEWLQFSETFRARVETLSRQMAQGELKLKTQALYLNSHLWSNAGPIWDQLFDRVGYGSKIVSSADTVSSERDAKLCVVDPSIILTKDMIEKLLNWAQGGRVLALPRSPYYSEAGREELENILSGTRRIEMNLGLTYRLHHFGEGKVVLFDLPEVSKSSTSKENATAWQNFLTSLLSVSEVETYCRLSDSRVKAIPLHRLDGSVGLFVMNSSTSLVSADLIFSGEVFISDLATKLHDGFDQDRSQVVPSSRFSLDVPPCGVMPLAVYGLGDDAKERRVAALNSEVLKQSADLVAQAELAGFDSRTDIGDLWN